MYPYKGRYNKVDNYDKYEHYNYTGTSIDLQLLIVELYGTVMLSSTNHFFSYNMIQPTNKYSILKMYNFCYKIWKARGKLDSHFMLMYNLGTHSLK